MCIFGIRAKGDQVCIFDSMVGAKKASLRNVTKKSPRRQAARHDRRLTDSKDCNGSKRRHLVMEDYTLRSQLGE